MAARLLQRIDLPSHVVQKLSERNIKTAKDVLSLTELELLEGLDLPVHALQQIVQQVSQSILGPPVTVLDLRNSSNLAPRYLPTGLKALDVALRGGIPCSGITELVGPAGIGKTQMCLLLSAAAALATPSPPGSQAPSVLYIDTERKFSSQRLVQIARGSFSAACAEEVAVQQLTQRVFVIEPASSADLLQRLQNLEAAIIDHGVKLVIVDSIAALARSEFGREQLAERQQQLGHQASMLKRLAEAFQIPIVVTNQVTTLFQPAPATGFNTADAQPAEQGHLTVALGTLWAHAVNTRLVLEGTGGARYIKVAKSPMAAAAGFKYTITPAGITLIEGSADGSYLQGSSINMVIANDAYQEPLPLGNPQL